MHLQTLSDTWQILPLAEFRQGVYPRDDEGWMPAIVPGHWQQLPALERHAGKVVYRCRFSLENSEQGSSEQENREQRNREQGATDGSLFSVPLFAKPRYWLRLNGVFYWAQPYLNGVDLGRHEGYFIPYEREVTEWLARENTLLVEVDCPDEHDKFGKRMITGVFSHWDCLDPQANPGGIWLPVELHASGPVRIQSVRCHSETFNERFAQLRYVAELDAARAGAALLRWTFTPRTFTGPPQVFEQRRVLRAGPQEIGGLLKLRDPRLWWTHDLGDPDLYTVTLELLYEDAVSDCHSFAFGVRRFELRNWIAYLNGVRFLIKGNNYPPGDMRIATMTPARCARDLELARNCHMNMLRVHAHVDHPAFYDAADEAGILLWQDFPLQWLYRREVLPEARRQVRAMVRQLYNHPCVAIWCMHNEAIFVADTADESLLTRLRGYNTIFGFSWNRDVMDTQLKQLAEREDPQRPVVRSSGEFDIPRLRTGTDAHAYFGWYRSYGTLRDSETLRHRFPGNLAFVTEFGAQSFPNVDSCHRFMPVDINDVEFDHLMKRHGFQGEVMANWIPWRQATSLAELVDMTQDYQIFINRYYIDRLRYYKYRPNGGIIPFLLLDPYPAILWSVVDYWRVPKRSYYALRMAFSPQYAFTVVEPRSFRVGERIDVPLYVVNDAQQAIPHVRLLASLRDPDGGLLARVERSLTLAADCMAQEVDRLRLTPTRPGRYALELELGGVAEPVHQIYEIEVV